MEPENPRDGNPLQPENPGDRTPPAAPSAGSPRDSHDLFWAIIGPNGVRAGWLVLLFYGLYRLFTFVLGGFVYVFVPALGDPNVSPSIALLSEFIVFTAMLAAGAIMLPVAHRRIADYNLRDLRGLRHFLSGLAIGFLAISILVGSMVLGGWLRFGAATLTTSGIFVYGAIWGLSFLLVACVEEGTFRCFGLWTLARGINFWWATAFVSGLCLYTYLFGSGDPARGMYAFAALGMVPCFLVHLRKIESSRFWQASWATSTAFGLVHTLNSGENWIGIFAAAFIGFAFCVSIWVTGSAWWAIGCHAAWDWAETYFYGTADSGFVAPGHLLTTSAAGNPLLSGGTDGPEGSLFIIPLVLLILAWLLVIYRRPQTKQLFSPAETERLAS